MSKELNIVAAFLAKNSFYKEAAHLKKIALDSAVPELEEDRVESISRFSKEEMIQDKLTEQYDLGNDFFMDFLISLDNVDYKNLLPKFISALNDKQLDEIMDIIEMSSGEGEATPEDYVPSDDEGMDEETTMPNLPHDDEEEGF